MISDRAPSDYLAEIRNTPNFPFDSVLGSHCLPVGDASPLLSDDFDKFVSWRQDKLWKEIQRVTALKEAVAAETCEMGPLHEAAQETDRSGVCRFQRSTTRPLTTRCRASDLTQRVSTSWWARLPRCRRPVLFFLRRWWMTRALTPKQWPTEQAQNTERERLFDIIRQNDGQEDARELPRCTAEACAEMLQAL